MSNDIIYKVSLSDMTASFLTASLVAVAGALIALLTRKGHATEGGHTVAH